MRYGTYAIAALLTAIAACSASGAVEEPRPGQKPAEGQSDGEAPIVDAGPSDGTPDIDLDAARPLTCGDAGFCETKLPKSDIGLPLSLRSVWVVDSKDVWSVTVEGYVLHYDGASWTTELKTNHELHSVWATPTSVWAGGETGLLVHRNAAGAWLRVEAGHAEPIHAIYGTGDSDVWFTRYGASVDHFDGSTLKRHSIDVPGLKVTTVFGRAGFGTYAAGYVPGAPPLRYVDDQPFVFELSPTNISVFNSSLPEQRSFVPLSGVVTDSADADRTVLLVGYEEQRDWAGNPAFRTKRCRLGPHNPVVIEVMYSVAAVDAWRVADRALPILAYEGEDIRLVWGLGFVSRWDESEGRTLGMGYEFSPGRVLGAHNNATDSWIVGSGFALKGARP